MNKWHHRATDPNDDSAQIDLLLDVEKSALYIVEVKHRGVPYVLTRSKRDKLLRRRRVLSRQVCDARTVFIQLISSSGVQANQQSREVLDFVYPVDCLLEAGAESCP